MSILTIKNKLYGWKSCSAEVYAEYYSHYGGSVCVHPRVLEFLTYSQGVKIDFFCKKRSAFCTFNESLLYKNKNLPFVFDDLLFPVEPECKIMLPYKVKRLSPVTQANFCNAIYAGFLKHKIAYVKASFSKKTERKRNAELRKIQQAGFEFHNFLSFDAKVLSQIYCDLFKLRWQNEIHCFDQYLLEDIFTELKDLIFGNVLMFKGNPCAFDLIFRAESPSWIYFDDINGGVDPQFMKIGAGTSLLWKNILDARTECQKKNKTLLFSLGAYLKGWDYKKQWCDIKSSGRVIF